MNSFRPILPKLIRSQPSNTVQLPGEPQTSHPTTASPDPTNASCTPPNVIPPLEADLSFNIDAFDLSDAELEDMIASAAQQFWASFPGEVGVGYQ